MIYLWIYLVGFVVFGVICMTLMVCAMEKSCEGVCRVVLVGLISFVVQRRSARRKANANSTKETQADEKQ